jgi:hypothetical protein
MGLREIVMQLIRSADVTRLERLGASEPRAMRHLLGRLWDPDEEVRRLAAAGVGAAAAAHPDLGRDVIRRLLWALNDESATHGVYGIAALGEIGARAPELMEPFVGPLVSYAWDDGLRLEILRALITIASVVPHLVAPHLDDVKRNIDPDERSELELAAQLWSLTEESHGTA